MRSLPRALPLALAVASGLVTTGLLYAYMQSQPQAAAPGGMEPMVVAAVNLDESQPVGEAALTVTQVAHRPDGAFASAEELKGRMPLVPIPKGQPILTSHLAPTGAKPALWHRIPTGHRAVTVGIDEVVGVGGFLKPGLRVDIVAVTRDDNNDWLTRTIVQNVPILATAQDDKSKKEDQKARIVPSATLLVTPAQAEAISLATEQGKIRLVLRSPEDNAIVKLPAVKTSTGTKPAPAAPAPAKPAPAAQSAAVVPPPRPQAPAPAGIEVIRGSQSEVVTP